MLKTALVGSIAAFACAGAYVGVQASQFTPKIVPNTLVGDVPVGGLTKEEAAKRVRIWWEERKLQKLNVTVEMLKAPLALLSPTELGVTVDDLESVKDLPMESLGEKLQEQVTRSAPAEKKFDVKFKTIQVDFKPLGKKFLAAIPKPRPATVRYEKGSVLVTKESASAALQIDDVTQRALEAVKANANEVRLTTTEAEKKISDEQLASIKEVVSSYTTRFSAGNTNRCANIKLASSKLDGVILMPGERASFNTVVGRRTEAAGYKEAGVLKNGKHDVGIGGGICQVSGTLYNAVLLANLKIVHRNNHSTPVPYLSPGRDATVDYGNLDLAFENTMETPIAISREYRSGALTFRVLGSKKPGETVKIVTANHKTWERGEERTIDRSLRPGRSTVVDAGSRGHSIDTYRYVYDNGQLVQKEHIDHSTYSGAPRLIAYNPAPAAPRAKPGVAAGQTSVALSQPNVKAPRPKVAPRRPRPAPVPASAPPGVEAVPIRQG